MELRPYPPGPGVRRITEAKQVEKERNPVFRFTRLTLARLLDQHPSLCAILDLNQEPTGYESDALNIELMALDLAAQVAFSQITETHVYSRGKAQVIPARKADRRPRLRCSLAAAAPCLAGSRLPPSVPSERVVCFRFPSAV